LVAARRADVERRTDRRLERSERPTRRNFGDDLRASRSETAASGGAQRPEAQRAQADSAEDVATTKSSTMGVEAGVAGQPSAGRAGAAAPVAANQPRPVPAQASTPLSTTTPPAATNAAVVVDAVTAPVLAHAAPVAQPGELGLGATSVDAPAVVEGARAMLDGAAQPGKEAVAQPDARVASAEPGRLSEIFDNKPGDAAASARNGDERAARQVETRERAADLLRQIGLQLSPQTRTAVVDLHPRELGRIHIRMSVEGGRVRASLRAERPEALEALERHLPELRAELARAGLDAQELSLSLGFEGRRGGADAGDGRQSRSTAPATDMRAATTDELAFVARRVARDGGVDTFA
jgi:flagellar hook-length control protein FliK